MAGDRRWLLIGVIVATVVGVMALVVVRDDSDDPSAGPTTTTTSPTSSTSSASTATSSTSTTAPSASTTAPSSSTAPTTTWGTGPATIVREGTSGRAEVALTFDGGSDVGYTTEILDVLAANGIKASFGLTGRWTTEHPELVARMAQDGHQLINHTWAHLSYTGFSTSSSPLPRAERLDELARAESAIVAAAGVGARPWFRPPYGDVDDSVLADVGSAGYRYVAMWTVDSLGWKGLSAGDITDRCLAGAEPGAVYLFHVGSASADHAALQPIIDGLAARGLRFTTLDGLVAP